MDELENDKMIYWFIFFAVIIVVAVFGYRFVFGYANEKQKEKDQEISEETINVDDYLGVWQLFGDDELPLQELLINVVDGATITFDYYVNDIAYFDSQTASLDEDTAAFEIFDRDELGFVKGKFTFKNDKLFLVITSTDIEGINAGTYQFTDRGKESLLD